jgi:predicted nucleic acid-binding protein
MTLVIDASVAAAWCFPDEAGTGADEALSRLPVEDAVVPAIWWFEIRNIFVVNERRGRIEPADTAEFLEYLGRLPIRIEPSTEGSEMVLTLARKHKLSAYDASYLALAKRANGTLATLDRALAAAGAREGLELLGTSSG